MADSEKMLGACSGVLGKRDFVASLSVLGILFRLISQEPLLFHQAIVTESLGHIHELLGQSDHPLYSNLISRVQAIIDLFLSLIENQVMEFNEIMTTEIAFLVVVISRIESGKIPSEYILYNVRHYFKFQKLLTSNSSHVALILDKVELPFRPVAVDMLKNFVVLFMGARVSKTTPLAVVAKASDVVEITSVHEDVFGAAIYLSKFETMATEELLKYLCLISEPMKQFSHEERTRVKRILIHKSGCGIVEILRRMAEDKNYADARIIKAIHDIIEAMMLTIDDETKPIMNLWIHLAAKNEVHHKLAFESYVTKKAEDKQLAVQAMVSALDGIEAKSLVVSLLAKWLDEIPAEFRSELALHYIEAGYFDYLISSWEALSTEGIATGHILSSTLYILEELQGFPEKENLVLKKIIPLLILISENDAVLSHMALNGLIQITSDLVAFDRPSVDVSLLSSNVLNTIISAHCRDAIAEQLTFDATIDMILILAKRSIKRVQFRVPSDMLIWTLEQYVTTKHTNAPLTAKIERLVKWLTSPPPSANNSSMPIVD